VLRVPLALLAQMVPPVLLAPRALLALRAQQALMAVTVL
jgi:hypothetical protein